MTEKRKIVQVEVESGVNNLVAHINDPVSKINREVEEKAWIRIDGQSGVFELKSCELVEINKVVLNLECYKGLTLQYPSAEYTVKLDETDVNLTSVSTSKDKIAIGAFDGSLVTFSADKNGAVTPQLVNRLSNANETENYKRDCHFMDVAAMKILPSNSVLASLGLEGSLKIWPLPSLNEAVREIRDRSRLSCFAIIGKGRNIITGSQDGSIIIWELGSRKKVWSGRRVKDIRDSVLSICVGELETVIGTSNTNADLFDVEKKMICVGHQSGVVSLWGAYNRLTLGEINTGINSVTSVFFFNYINIVVGLSNGEVQMWKYNFEDKVGSMEWSTFVEVFEDSNDLVEIKKVAVMNKTIVVLTENRFVTLSMEGELKEYLVGYDHNLNDFDICGDKITSVAKYGQIYIHNL